MTARRVLFEGRVQGVGFRYTVKNIARGYEVTGWVRNLPDGRVELQAASIDPAELDDFILEIRERSPLAGHIKAWTSEPLDLPPVARGFEIIS
jgi:acylphosphatase